MASISEKRLSQEDLDEVIKYGSNALIAIESCIKELEIHLEKIDNMESKYLVKKFDDVDDIYRELNQMSENIANVIERAREMGVAWFAIDSDHNLLGL